MSLGEYSRTFVVFIFEPGHIGLAVAEPAQSGVANCRIRNLDQRRVPWVVRFLVRIVPRRVVATDHGPSRIVGPVLIGAVQEIGVKEQDVAWIHLDVDQLEPFQYFIHPFQVGPCLISRQNVVDPPQIMRSTEDLKAAILARRRVHGDRGAAQEGKEDAVLIQ